MDAPINIAICYFMPINSTFYKNHNLDKNEPYNGVLGKMPQDWEIPPLLLGCNQGNNVSDDY